MNKVQRYVEACKQKPEQLWFNHEGTCLAQFDTDGNLMFPDHREAWTVNPSAFLAWLTDCLRDEEDQVSGLKTGGLFLRGELPCGHDIGDVRENNSGAYCGRCYAKSCPAESAKNEADRKALLSGGLGCAHSFNKGRSDGIAAERERIATLIRAAISDSPYVSGAGLLEELKP